MKKYGTILRALCLIMSISLFPCLLVGCFAGTDSSQTLGNEQAAAAGGKTFVLGDTTFNPENEEPDINPHNAYSGWACIRYGVGETLFRYSDAMELEPWLAESWEQADADTWVITLRDTVYFTSGRKMDGQAVKECLEHLIQVHSRARSDLMIRSIEADGQTVTIRTKEPKPALLNYLSDP